MMKGQKGIFLRIGITVFLIFFAGVADLNPLTSMILYAAAYFIIGHDILREAAERIKDGDGLDECVLMAVATLGAWGLALYENDGYTEAVAVMLFYQIGERFQSYAVDRSRRNVTALIDSHGEYVHVEKEDGSWDDALPETVPAGSVIVVKAGEKILLDGRVLSGSGSLNMAALTGESLPLDVKRGQAVLSGSVNLKGVLRVETTKGYNESTATKILRLIEEAGARKSRAEQFITRFARVYTPAVVGSAALLALLPPLYGLIVNGTAQWYVWVYRALIFLVISCPCALVISVPLTFFAAVGRAGKEGILIKGSQYVERLAHVKTVVFDKTGTLTKGKFDVVAVHPSGLAALGDAVSGGTEEERLLHLTAHVESFSAHPIAEALRIAYAAAGDGCAVAGGEEVAGKGMRAVVNGHAVCVGNGAFMEDCGAAPVHCGCEGTIIHVAVDGKYAGHIVISDVVKPHAAVAVKALKEKGIRRLVMLTGDGSKTAAAVADELGITEVYSELLPADKVRIVEGLTADLRQPVEALAFTGDGLNDAPVLARADVGVAMGALGSDAAVEAADVVLMDDDPLKLAAAVKIAQKGMVVVKENIVFAIGIKIFVLLLGAAGTATMGFAVFADVGVMVLAVLNALRLLFVNTLPQESR